MLLIEGNSAPPIVSRSSDADIMVQNIQTRFMIKGERYAATAKMRLHESDGTQFECDTTQRRRVNACPDMRLRSFVNVGLPTQGVCSQYGGFIAQTDHGVTTYGWYAMSGIFEAGRSVLSFPGAK
jgi:hypothetical protein